MSRTKSSLFAFAVFTLLLTIAFAVPNSAFAFGENEAAGQSRSTQLWWCGSRDHQSRADRNGHQYH